MAWLDPHPNLKLGTTTGGRSFLQSRLYFQYNWPGDFADFNTVAGFTVGPWASRTIRMRFFPPRTLPYKGTIILNSTTSRATRCRCPSSVRYCSRVLDYACQYGGGSGRVNSQSFLARPRQGQSWLCSSCCWLKGWKYCSLANPYPYHRISKECTYDSHICPWGLWGERFWVPRLEWDQITGGIKWSHQVENSRYALNMEGFWRSDKSRIIAEIDTFTWTKTNTPNTFIIEIPRKRTPIIFPHALMPIE